MIRGQTVSAGCILLVLTLVQGASPQGKDKKPSNVHEMKELAKKVFHLTFEAGKEAKIEVKSRNETDVDLFVEEMDGTEVVSDTDDSKDCSVIFTPLKMKTYRVSIVNLGPGDNKCTLTHTGKEAKIDWGKTADIKPFDLAEMANKSFDVKLSQGKQAAVWVSSEKATDVDVFVFAPDGTEIAKDEHISKDAFVSFVPKASGSYRIEVRNLGPGDNRCSVKHTVAEKK